MEKLCYVRMLVELDQIWRFRFLDLVPELRNLMYGYLLQLRPSEKHQSTLICSPAIIAVCKQVHAEAQAMLYKVNTFDIHIRSIIRPLKAERADNITTMVFTKLDVEDVVMTDALMNDIDNAWPQHIRRAESLRLTLKLEDGHDKDAHEERCGSNYQQTNHILHSLVALKSVKRVQLQLKQYPTDLGEDTLKSILKPLSLRTTDNGGRMEVRMYNVPEAVEAFLAARPAKPDGCPESLCKSFTSCASDQ
jgi:preprotein translocase subunit SecA